MMKTKHFLICAIAGLSVLGGCEKEDTSWKIINKDIFASKYQYQYGIAVERADLSLTVVVDAATADWCIFNHIYSNDDVGIVTIVIDIESNLTSEQRIAHVTVSKDGRSEVATITQEAGDATILIDDHTMIELDYTAGTYSIPVTSNASWTATVDAAVTWCTLTTASGKGDGAVIINVQEAIFRRYTTITVSAGTLQDSVMVFQHGAPVHDPGVNIDGVIWATRNVNDFGTFVGWLGEAGKFYQYNRTVAYTSTDPLSPAWDDTYPEMKDWMLINDPCPGGWRVPSMYEYQSLAASGWRWVTAEESGLGIPGIWFGPGAQDADPYPTVPDDAVFFPAAGARIVSDGHLLSIDDKLFACDGKKERACFWTKDNRGGVFTYPMVFGSQCVYPGGGVLWTTCMALSIRCVKR
jgi:hypothetical protein